MAPSPRLQKLNALLHREPYASIAYSIFWTWILVAVAPVVAMIVLPILGIYRLIAWYRDWWGVEDFDPARHSESTELAVVITGCDSGFGKELALWAAEAGFFVFAGCLSKDSFEQFKVKNAGSRITPMIMDVTNDVDVKKAADQVSKWLSDESSKAKKKNMNTKKRVLHALINNAGITKVGMFDWIEIDDYRRVMEVNFFGVLRTCKAFLPLLKKQSVDGGHKRGSRIINLTSIAGLLTSSPMRARSTYAASKHASQSLTEVLREELAGFDIQVTSVNPTYHNSGFAANMVSNLEKTYTKKISPSLRQEYGDEFLNGIAKNIDSATNTFSWNLDVVVEKMLQTIKQRQMPAQLVIGIDGQYLYILTRMLPSWVTTFRPSWVAKIVPQIMKKNQQP